MEAEKTVVAMDIEGMGVRVRSGCSMDGIVNIDYQLD
jgi:hypothetical protein